MLNKTQEMEPSGAAFHAASLGEDGRKNFRILGDEKVSCVWGSECE